MPEEEDTMPDTQEGNDSSVDKSKSDLDQTWGTIKTYVAKIKDAIRKLNERINKQIHENLRTYMKTGKINASSKAVKAASELPRVAVRKKKAMKKVAMPVAENKVTAAAIKKRG
jgi:hypothetical protein